LILGGLSADKVGRVVGLASSVLLDAQVPDSPINRRISIVVMNKRTEDAIAHENGTLLSVQDTARPAAEGAEPVAAVTPAEAAAQ
jgi:chemotaxis protein MotB